MLKKKNKKNLNITKKKIIIGFVLLVSWLFLTFIYLYSTSFLSTIIETNLEENSFSISNDSPNKISINNYHFGELLKGDKLHGSFTANENYLGQVQIRFYNFNRINPDSVAFRIKEKGAGSWFYEGKYKTDQFQPNLFFTFGFPVIPDSKNKKYIFEVESIDGKEDHAIGISSVKPLGATLYQYPKKLLLSNPQSLANFMIDNRIKKIELNSKLFVAIGIYINFILLSLLLIYFSLIYVFEKKVNKFPKINSFTVTLSGLLLLTFSVIILYLKMAELSFLLTTIGYFTITVGILLMIIDFKRK